MDDFVQLSESISLAVREHIAKSKINWPNKLAHPFLRVELFLENKDESQQILSRPVSPIASSRIDLVGLVATVSPHNPTANASQTLDNGIRDDAKTTGTTNDEIGPREVEPEPGSPSRRGTGSLRVSRKHLIQEDLSEHQRQIVSDARTFPKRRKVTSEQFVFLPSTLDKLIIGIWEQLHGTLNMDPEVIFEQMQISPAAGFHALKAPSSDIVRDDADSTVTNDEFQRMNVFCRKVSQSSRVCRSMEIIVQARWVELFDEQVQNRISTQPQISPTKHRKAAFMGACKDFGWSEKELRNKISIWGGYKELKDAAGWVPLIFAGMGIYRFCKYRAEFTKDAMKRLHNLQHRFEVAADTLHPNWRRILGIVGVSSRLQYGGHPHDWVVFEDGSDPVPLRVSYLQQDPHFHFEHLEESIIDESTWGCDDPRWVPQSKAVLQGDTYTCALCGENQSDDPGLNSCYCFPSLFGCVKRRPSPVQICRSTNGRNNALLALTPFDRGSAIGEFVGLITKDIRHLDVMDSSTATTSYQIWQGRQGNFTRFINHSCKANAQFTQFVWLDTQHIILVSKGIDVGAEILVDYGDRYWVGLDKKCLCGESCCRYA